MNIYFILFALIYSCRSDVKEREDKPPPPPNPYEFLEDTLKKDVYIFRPNHVPMGFIFYPSQKRFSRFYESCLDHFTDTGYYDLHNNSIWLFSTKNLKSKKEKHRSLKPSFIFKKHNGLLVDQKEKSWVYFRCTSEKYKNRNLPLNGNGNLILLDTIDYDIKEFGEYKNYKLINGYVRKNRFQYDTIVNSIRRGR